MKYLIATVDDINEILELHNKYHINTIKEEDKKDGFIITSYTKEQLEQLIITEQSVFIVRLKDKIVAYLISSSWQFCSQWPIFIKLLKNLEHLNYLEQNITMSNSYHYGPVCIDQSVRGIGILETLFDFSRKHMSTKYRILIAFINKTNLRSFNAHTRKVGLEIIEEFEFNDSKYYVLAHDTWER